MKRARSSLYCHEGSEAIGTPPNQSSFERLINAARRGDLTTARDILTEDPRLVNAHCYDGATVLMYAASVGQTKMIHFLCDMGANIESADFLGYTALMFAAQNGHENAVYALLDRNANWRAENSAGQNAGRLAIHSKHYLVANQIAYHVPPVK